MGIAKGNSIKHKEIGRRIRDLRINKGVTQNEIANILGMKSAGYSKLESGGCALGYEHCITLADFYGVTCDYILRGINAENVDIYKKTNLSQASVLNLSSVQAEREEIIQKIRETQDSFNNDANELSIDEYWNIIHNLRKRLIVINIRTWIVNRIIEEPIFLQKIGIDMSDALDSMLNALYDIDLGFSIAYDYEPNDDILNFEQLRTNLNACQYVTSILFSKLIKSCFMDPAFVLSSLQDVPESNIDELFEYRNLLSTLIKKAILE